MNRSEEMHIFDKSPVSASDLPGLNGTYEIDNDICSGEMMIRSIKDVASIASFHICFGKNEIIDFCPAKMLILDCFDSVQGIRIQNGEKISLMPGLMYSCGRNAEMIQMMFSPGRPVSWYVMIIDPCKCDEYINSLYPGMKFDAHSLFSDLDGHSFYNELQVIFAQLTGRPNRAASEMYYEGKFKEILAWLIEYADKEDVHASTQNSRITESDRIAIMRTADMIRQNPGAANSLSELASAALVSTSKLRKDFKAVMGCSISEFRNQEKLRLANTLLVNSELTYKEIAERLGYKKLENFNLFFKRNMKLTPHEFREAHNL